MCKKLVSTANSYRSLQPYLKKLKPFKRVLMLALMLTLTLMAVLKRLALADMYMYLLMF